jgi:stage V sporulation protein B
VSDPEPNRDPGAEPKGDTARQAGRGGLAIAGAKLYFIVMGLAQQIALKHLLGLGGYGALGRVQSVASIVYNPIIATSVQGMSRAVSASPDDEQAAAQRRVLTIHAVAILPFALLFLLLAPTVAGWIRAPHLTNALRILAGVLLFYGLYTPLVGALNGKKRFGWQAGLDALAATLRTIGLLGGAYLLTRSGLGVEGALIGFVASAALMTGIALPLAGRGRRGAGGPTTREYLLFALPLFAGQIALNLLFQCDLTLLGRFASDSALHMLVPHLDTVADGPGLELLRSTSARAADSLAGAYRAAQLFCFLPYQLLLSVTFVLFPLLSSAHRDGDREAVARYVRTGVRLALVLAGLMVSVTAGLPGPLLRLVFGADTAALGAEAMLVMALGLGSFAIFGILATVLTSLKHEVLSMALTLVALALVVLLCFALVRGTPFGSPMLLRTGLATGCGLLVATVLTAAAVKAKAGAVVSPLTVLRVIVGIGVAVAVARALPSPGAIATIAYAALVGLSYLVVLMLGGELTRADVRLVRGVLGRRR